uniref:Exosome complex component 10 n=1 Tax=Phallusia mammillata TaxID=59560 RepID=A0A6F9DBQ1_9ASCI|nr:exosome component 10-like [Phallusia mammillata]
MEEKPSTSENVEINADETAKQSLGSVLQFVRSTHGFPGAGDDFEFYSSYAGFRDFVADQKTRLLNGMSQLLSNQGLKKNFGTTSTDIDEYTDCLIECNDGLLERVSVLIDECSGVRKTKDTSEKSPDILTNSAAVEEPKTVISSWNKVNKQGKSKTFRLMQAHNILRPQLKFSEVIDNTNTPFVPKLTTKPNALKPLGQSLLEAHIKADPEHSSVDSLIKQARKAQTKEFYEHPYKYELEHWEPEDEQLGKVNPVKYEDSSPDEHVMITTVPQLQDLLNDLKCVKEFAVDLEHHSYRTFQGITCLMQISTRTNDYIVDTLLLRSDLHILNEVFTDPAIVKVFHGADSDVMWLQRDFGIYIVNLFDTGIASHSLQLPRHSLDFLLHYYCDLNVDKKFQLADWRIRPIPEEMIAYAKGDTHYLLYVYDLMRNELVERDNGNSNLLRHVLNSSRDLCLMRYEKPLTTPISHLLLLERRNRRGKGKALNTQQMEALRLIYNWRDSMARQEDESTGYVLPNHMLLQIAEILPREAQGVLACCNPIPPLLRQHVSVVHRLVMDARTKPNAKPGTSAKESNQATPETRVPVPAKSEDTYEDFLRCPHDWSRGRPAQISFPRVQKGKIKFLSTSSLFGPAGNESTPKSVRYASTPTKPDSKVVLQKLNAIRQATWNPFQLFMPGGSTKSIKRTISESVASDSNNVSPPTLRQMLSGDFVWKMKRMEEDEKEEVKIDNDPPKTFGTVINVPEEARRGTEEQAQVLRNMMKPRKHAGNRTHGGHEKHQHSFSAPAVTFEPTQPNIHGQFHNQAAKRGFKRNRPGGNSNFVPHKFSDDDYSRFQRRGSMKKKQFRH